VQGELALTAYQIASGGQSESGTENIEFVQRELAHTAALGQNHSKAAS
jgi:hypothetical protein